MQGIVHKIVQFQSTSSVWRTTDAWCSTCPLQGYFNPRPPCGGRRKPGTAAGTARAISIHVLRVEDDPARPRAPRSGEISIHVLRVEDDAESSGTDGESCKISIHVLRVEDDVGKLPCLCTTAYFNPRPPCGGRPSISSWSGRNFAFQSTSSVWRTTAKTEKNLYLHSYNTAICTNSQPKHSAYAFVCTTNPKQSPQKPVRSIRVRSARFTFARPSPPGEALRKSARHPAGRRGELRCVQPCFDNGCPAGKSAGCPLPGRSVWSARP